MALASKVAIVTGASGTIGAAIATHLARAGANVVVSARRVDKLEALRTELGGDRCEAVGADVTDEASVAALFERAAARFERVDVLVNAAGVAINGPTTQLSASDFRRVLDVNVVGAFLVSREAFRHKTPRVINVGSISARAPRPDSAAYTASKFALDGLTRSLALDGRALGIAVSVVHPGNVASELLSPEEFAWRKDREGLCSADDVAACVVLMAGAPDGTNVLEVTVMPTTQPLVGRG